MPRVKRTLVLTVLIACSCAVLLLQLRFLRRHVHKPHILNPAGQLTTGHGQWQTLKKFLELAQRHRMPLFLADVATLSHLTQDALQQHQGPPPPHQGPPPPHQGPLCSFLCSGRPVAAFALQASRWKYDAGFLLAAEQRGFELMEFRGEDPRLASFDSLSGEEIPLHFLFRLHGFVIQVVFLYERSGNYLWHGALRLKAGADRSFAPFTLLDYGRHAGAYDRPELVLTVLDGLDVRVPRNVSHFLAQQRHAHFLECRYREARGFLQLYPDDASPPALEFRRKAKALLHLAARALARIHVPFWISSGTCLGEPPPSPCRHPMTPDP
ncbi:fukutin-like isoform X2 [Salarias fasciatus]|uniref:Fukutin-like n=1 Tax=Salarias fasciatus TaxID=181472 RepID=A0A672HWW7_SALFA|nr:fukutin-like isoform X2 [Salarias fasciatus]